MDCSPPGSPVPGILQAGTLEWVALSFSRGSSRPRDGTWVSCITGRLFSNWATREGKALPPNIATFWDTKGSGLWHMDSGENIIHPVTTQLPFERQNHPMVHTLLRTRWNRPPTHIAFTYKFLYALVLPIFPYLLTPSPSFCFPVDLVPAETICICFQLCLEPCWLKKSKVQPACGLPLVAEREGYCCGGWASDCGGFSCFGAQALGAHAPVVAALGLSSCGPWP